jgi:hypothetical protein
MGEFNLSAEPIHTRWNRALEQRLRVGPGDSVFWSRIFFTGSSTARSAATCVALTDCRNLALSSQTSCSTTGANFPLRNAG